MEAFIAGAWRSPTRGEFIVGGAARRLTRGEAYIGGQWRSIASFVGPLSVSAPTANAGGLAQTSADRQKTASSTATPSGGLPPFSYSWQLLSGAMTLLDPLMATARFTAIVPAETTISGTARVTCTDAAGASATATIAINLNNYSTGGLS